jgi:predicted nucleic acid-binding protein
VIAIVDSGPLYAVVDAGDDEHDRCRETLESSDLQLIIPALVVGEVTYMVARRLGPEIEAAFLRGLARFEIEAPAPEDWPRMAELVKRYREFPLGGTDASVVALAERLETDLVITLDHRHFAAIRPRHRPAFRLLPE